PTCPPHALSPSFFPFHPAPTPALDTLSLHDALPISPERSTRWQHRLAARPARIPARSSSMPMRRPSPTPAAGLHPWPAASESDQDRKSTRLNSSHVAISYAVFCLKKKK